MSTTILSLEELQNARDSFDHLHEGCIDLCATLESGNYGCPVEGTEEIRKILGFLSGIGFPFLKVLDQYIEWQEKEEEGKKNA